MQKNVVIKKSALTPTALIAGGAGFIGSYLAETLLAKGCRVVVLDNFESGKEIKVSHLLKNPKFALFEVDVNFTVPKKIESVDYIFHLAGLEDYLFSKESLNLDALLTGSLGVKNLLDLAVKSDAKFLLVSTTDVIQTGAPRLDIKEYFGHTEVGEKKYSFTDAKRFSEALLWEHYRKFSTDVRIARVPEVYGPKMSLEAGGFLGYLLRDLAYKRDLTIYGPESQKQYYLYITDAISGLVKALFTDGTKGKTYSLVGERPYSVLETAFLIKKLADRRIEVKVKSSPKDKTTDLRIPDVSNLRDLSWGPRMSFKDGIIKTMEALGERVNQHSFKQERLVEEKSKEKIGGLFDFVSVQHDVVSAASKKLKAKRNYKKFFRPIESFVKKLSGINFGITVSIAGALFMAICIFFVIPVFRIKGSAGSGMKDLEKVKSHLLSLNSTEAIKEAESAYKNFEITRKSFNSLRWAYSIIGEKNKFSSLSKMLGSISYLSRSVHSVVSAVEPMGGLWEILRPDSAKTLDVSSFDKSKLAINTAKNYIQLARADFLYVDKNLLPRSVRNYYDEYSRYLDALLVSLDAASVVISEFPNTLGAYRPQKYLILFQNSNEIRPTGGFIGSYGILEINKGKISNLVIDDIYNPDGQIDVRNIRVTPPSQISTFLKEDRLHLRNANWDPDFTRSAGVIKDLFFKIYGEKIDGVIAIDLYFVQNLLEVTGPIYLASYNEEISAQNLYERAQLHSEFNYKSGSDQKKNFLTILGSKLLERIFSMSKEEIGSVYSAIGKSLSERHMMIYFSNSPINSVLAERKWDGGLVKTTGDYLSIVNANLGGTKANYYVKNSYTYQIFSKTRDGLLRAELELNYNHTGKDNSWPGGPYTNYVRVLVQKGAKLTSAKIIRPGGLEEDIFNKTVRDTVGIYPSFETSFVLPPNSSIKIVLGYDLPQNLSITKDFKKYSLYWQKQSGSQNDAYIFELNPPFGMTPDMSSEKGFLNTDKEIFITLK